MEVYIVRTFAREENRTGLITNDMTVYASAEALLKGLRREGNVSDEFGQMEDGEELERYICDSANAIVKVKSETAEMCGITVEGHEAFYHVTHKHVFD